EPFRLYRPETCSWEDGYARSHRRWLTRKNQQADQNFIPAIKVFKHLHSHHGLDGVSFHIECLLFNLPNNLFAGSRADYICRLLEHLAASSAADWYDRQMPTPCGERDIFTPSEWVRADWLRFHGEVEAWVRYARRACTTKDRDTAVEAWQLLLGKDY